MELIYVHFFLMLRFDFNFREIDGKTYKAYVKEKQEAQKIYDTAVQQGQTAAHINQR